MSDGPILVLGASGFVGRTLIASFADAGRPAVGLSHAECDIIDRVSVGRALARYRPHLVINTAAFANVDAAEADPAAATAVNTEGPAILGDATAAAGMPLVHFSTDYVFDGAKRAPYREDDPVAPLSHYGQTKAAGEARLRAVQPRHVILRTAWLFGRNGGGFVQQAIDAAGRRQPIRAITDQSGCPTAVADLVLAIRAVNAAILAGRQPWGTYHYAGKEPARRIDIAEAILDAMRGFGREVPPIVAVRLADLDAEGKRPAYSALDSSRFTATFGLAASDWRRRLTEFVGEEMAAMTEQAAP
jgi:dTDP-4-dehydrorhamnose reductase